MTNLLTEVYLFQLIDTQLLENSLDVACLRQRVISHNVANAKTPGFQGQQVRFESELREAMESGQDATQVKPTLEYLPGGCNLQDEMANLAKNQIQYNALVTRTSSILGSLRWIIENSGR